MSDQSSNQQNFQSQLNYQPGYQSHSQGQPTQPGNQNQMQMMQMMQQLQYYQNACYQFQLAQQQQGQQNFQLSKENALLQQKFTSSQEELKKLEEESQNEISKYKQKVKALQLEITVLSQKNNDLDFDHKSEEAQKVAFQKKYKELEAKNSLLKDQINKFKIEIEDKNAQITTLQNNEKKLALAKAQNMDANFQQMLSDKDAEIQKQKALVNQFKHDLENQRNEQQKLKTEFEEKISILQEEINKEHRSFLQSQDVIKNWQDKFKNAQNQIRQKDQNIDDLNKILQKETIEKKKLTADLSSLKESLEQSKSEIRNLEKVIEQLKQYLKNPQASNQDELKKIDEEMKKIKQLSEQQQQNLNQKNKENQDKLQQQLELQKQKQNEKLEKLAQQKKEAKNQGRTLVAQLMSKATEVQGQLDICYVIDSTISMEPYIQQARRCVRDSLKIIKASTNRDTNISAICYYDIEQRPKEGNYQLNFTKNPQQLEDFLDSIKCARGRDNPEDVQGAFDQMLTKIQWKNKFRLAILITDAPCHGQKYHNQKDCHPNMDITQTLHNIANSGIILIGFNLKAETQQMYDEFQKVYKAIQKQDQFFRVEVSGQQVDKLAEQMAKTLGQASEQATQVKNQGTKSKKQQQERPENKDGAMEALCKQGNFYNFETQDDVKTVKTNFTVFKVEISDQAFEDNFKQINKIGQQNNHYQITNEGKWDCIRTEKPFAFGMMKDVFLMKKVTAMENELFVIKTPIGSQPYPSLELAIAECRSHLICQKLVKKFRTEIEQAKEQSKQELNVPNVNYSDFLILQENNGKFWIAEKFFKGEFVKYNNNFGFVNPDINELNKFAQAFSYYTFFISNGKYLVNDVQGVGNYFTDPAINTNTGDFDDTDLGLEGQQMYLVSFEWKKHLAFDYLGILEITYENDDALQQRLVQG